MNRHERRKLSRDASPEEIFPGRHGPVQASVADQLRSVIHALEEGFPGYNITLFIAERDAEGRMPRFNYASTGAREDMIAVLKAFILKNEAEGATVEKINDEPPTPTKQ